MLAVPALQGLSQNKTVYYWGRHWELVSRFCPVQGFSLDSFPRTSAGSNIQHWASVGPCEYLKLKGEVVLLQTHHQGTEPKWSEWCKALGVSPSAPQLYPEHLPPAQHVLLAPGSGSELKNWPLACFGQVLEILQGHNILFNILFGPVELERGLLNEWQNHFPQWSSQFLPCENINELLGLLKQEVFYVGCDSGPGHLAAICGCRGLIIFQHSHPLIWRPWSDRLTCVGSMGSPPTVQGVSEQILSHFQSCPSQAIIEHK